MNSTDDAVRILRTASQLLTQYRHLTGRRPFDDLALYEWASNEHDPQEVLRRAIDTKVSLWGLADDEDSSTHHMQAEMDRAYDVIEQLMAEPCSKCGSTEDTSSCEDCNVYTCDDCWVNIGCVECAGEVPSKEDCSSNEDMRELGTCIACGAMRLYSKNDPDTCLTCGSVARARHPKAD